MQALNPTVYELFIWYGRRPANRGLEPTAQIASAQRERCLLNDRVARSQVEFRTPGSYSGDILRTAERSS
jgi:hypothetical protein